MWKYIVGFIKTSAIIFNYIAINIYWVQFLSNEKQNFVKLLCIQDAKYD